MGSRQNTISAGRDFVTGSLDRVGAGDVYRHPERFLDEVRHRRNRLRHNRRVADRSLDVKVRSDQFARAGADAFADYWNVVQHPIDGVERKHTYLHIERACTELNAATRRDIHHRALQCEVVGVEKTALALEIGEERFEWNAGDARVRDLRAQPILNVDKTEQAREQRKLVEGSVADRNGQVAGEGLEEIGVGVGP